MIAPFQAQFKLVLKITEMRGSKTPVSRLSHCLISNREGLGTSLMNTKLGDFVNLGVLFLSLSDYVDQ